MSKPTDETIRTTTASPGWTHIPEPSAPAAPKKSAASGTGRGADGKRSGGAVVPGSDFMSNEDIRVFSETLRRSHRERAVERAMDAEQLQAVLGAIPSADGSLHGSRMRARKVARHLKRIAEAEKLAAKESAALYAAFEREYDAELRKIGKGRVKQHRRPGPFAWS